MLYMVSTPIPYTTKAIKEFIQLTESLFMLCDMRLEKNARCKRVCDCKLSTVLLLHTFHDENNKTDYWLSR